MSQLEITFVEAAFLLSQFSIIGGFSTMTTFSGGDNLTVKIKKLGINDERMLQIHKAKLNTPVNRK